MKSDLWGHNQGGMPDTGLSRLLIIIITPQKGTHPAIQSILDLPIYEHEPLHHQADADNFHNMGYV